MIIYKVTCLVTNKIYIGKTNFELDYRKSQHLYCMRKKPYKSIFHQALLKYGPENFVWEIIDQCLFTESLIALEKHYIGLFNCMSPSGMNLTSGGEGTPGLHMLPESKEKMSASWKMRSPVTPETKAKISASVIESMTPEAREKRSVALLGRKLTPETKARMSASKKGNRTHGMSGKHHSKETKKKMSVSQKKRRSKI